VAKKPQQTEKYSRRYGEFFSGKIRDFGALLHYFYDVFHQNNKAGESELTGPGGQAI